MYMKPICRYFDQSIVTPFRTQLRDMDVSEALDRDPTDSRSSIEHAYTSSLDTDSDDNFECDPEDSVNCDRVALHVQKLREGIERTHAKFLNERLAKIEADAKAAATEAATAAIQTPQSGVAGGQQ